MLQFKIHWVSKLLHNFEVFNSKNDLPITDLNWLFHMFQEWLGGQNHEVSQQRRHRGPNEKPQTE